MRLRPAASPRATELTLPRKPLWSSLPPESNAGARAELYTPTLSPASSEASFSVPPPVVSGAGSSTAGSSAAGTRTSFTTTGTGLRREDAAIRIQCAFWAWQSAREAECPMPHAWEAVTAEDGRVYYWNSTTDETSWTLPSGEPEPCRSGEAAEGRRTDLPRAPDPVPLCTLPTAVHVPPITAENLPPSTAAIPPPAIIGGYCASMPNPDLHPHPIPNPGTNSPPTTVRGRRTSVKETKNELHSLRNRKSVSAFDNSKLERAIGQMIGAPSAVRRSQFSRSAGGWELRTHKAVSGVPSSFRDALAAALMRRPPSLTDGDMDGHGDVGGDEDACGDEESPAKSAC